MTCQKALGFVQQQFSQYSRATNKSGKKKSNVAIWKHNGSQYEKKLPVNN
jgi:hypothetical protein